MENEKKPDTDNEITLLPKRIKEVIKRQYGESMASEDKPDVFLRLLEERLLHESTQMIYNGVKSWYNNKTTTNGEIYGATESTDITPQVYCGTSTGDVH